MPAHCLQGATRHTVMKNEGVFLLSHNSVNEDKRSKDNLKTKIRVSKNFNNIKDHYLYSMYKKMNV